MNKLKDSCIAVFGIGGVGSYVVEALARCGIGKLVLVDFDDISLTNINRQIHANEQTIGKLKVDVMKERILLINPDLEVLTYSDKYTPDNSENFFDNYTYVIDAIDMVTSKINLIQKCIEKNIPIISCMGTGNKLNPMELEVTDIYKTSVCPLAKVMRKELKKRGVKKLDVLYSKEIPIKPMNGIDDDQSRRQTPGSVSFVPSVAGLIIASEVVKNIIEM